MSEIDTVRGLNSIFERYEFTALRDAMEGSSADAISSGTAFDKYELEHRDYEQVGDSILVNVVHRGRGRGSGLEVELAQAQR